MKQIIVHYQVILGDLDSNTLSKGQKIHSRVQGDITTGYHSFERKVILLFSQSTFPLFEEPPLPTDQQYKALGRNQTECSLNFNF